MTSPTDASWPDLVALFAALGSAGQAACVDGDLRACLAKCLGVIPEVLPADLGLIGVRDQRTGESLVVTTAPHGDAGPELSGLVLRGLRGTGETWTSDPVCVEDAQQTGAAQRVEDPLGEYLAGQGMRSWYRVPLVSEGNLDGLLVLASRAPFSHSAERLPLADLIGRHLTSQFRLCALYEVVGLDVVLHRGLLTVALGLSAQDGLESTLELVTEIALEMARGREAHLATASPDTRGFDKWCSAPPRSDEAQRRAAVEAFMLAAMQAGALTTAPAHQDGDLATMALPLVAGGTPIACLWVQREVGTAFRRHEVSGLRVLAAMAAVAIHNANLRELTQRQLDHLEQVAEQALREEARSRTLLQIAGAVSEMSDLQQILGDMARAACDEIGFERVRVYLADHERQELRGQVEARSGEAPRPWGEDVVPLAGGNQLVDAALGGATHVAVVATAESPDEVPEYDRLCVPLAAQQVLVGLLVADNPVSGAPHSQQQIELLRSLTGLVSVAVERARVDKLRGTLVSAVSHEMRAPLASIRAYNELVMAGDAGPINDEQAGYLERVEKSCARLERVICDLLHLSKLRAGEVAVSPGPVDLSSVIEGVMDTMYPRALAAKVQLVADECEPLPPIVTDAGRLEQVLTNLVDNAIKFNNPGGSVKLGLRRVGDEVVFGVTDDGPGIPVSLHAAVFNEFHHGTDSRSRAKEGAGLGLAIVARVVRMVGGRVWLESEVGKGSTFRVALPFEVAGSAPSGSHAPH